MTPLFSTKVSPISLGTLMAIPTETLQWLQDTINREVRQFVYQIERDEGIPNFDFAKYLEVIQLSLPQEAIHTRKLPKQYQRCQARINKAGRESQCSHRSTSGRLCLTHAKSDLKYGIVTEEIPAEFQHLFSSVPLSSMEENLPNPEVPESSLVDYQTEYDLTLIPLSRQNLKAVQIRETNGRQTRVLYDSLTKYIYTSNPKNPKFIGQVASRQIIR